MNAFERPSGTPKRRLPGILGRPNFQRRVLLPAILLGAVTCATLVNNEDTEPKCGVGVVAAQGGTAWNTAGEAARDAEVPRPDIVTASGMLSDEANKKHGVQPGQTWKVCFEGTNPISVEPTTRPIPATPRD